MSGVKKNIFNGAFLLLVLLITLYSVFHGENLSELLIYLKQGDLRYWLLGAVFVVGFIESESVIIYYMMKVLGENVKLTHCFLYSFVGFFFSLIPPLSGLRHAGAVQSLRTGSSVRFLPENPIFIPEIHCRLWSLLRYRDRKKTKVFSSRPQLRERRIRVKWKIHAPDDTSVLWGDASVVSGISHCRRKQ